MRPCIAWSTLCEGYVETPNEDITKTPAKSRHPSAIFTPACNPTTSPEIVNAPSSQSSVSSWIRFLTLLGTADKAIQRWYLSDTVANPWSVGKPGEVMSTYYHCRMLKFLDP